MKPFPGFHPAFYEMEPLVPQVNTLGAQEGEQSLSLGKKRGLRRETGAAKREGRKAGMKGKEREVKRKTKMSALKKYRGKR